MDYDNNFIKAVLNAFKKIKTEIEKDKESLEHDIRYEFVKHFLESVLGYNSSNVKWEKDKADLTIIDENSFPIVKIETKRPSEDIDKIKHEEQAFKYKEEPTKFIGLTNYLQFKLWEIKKGGSKLLVDINFSNIIKQKKRVDQLTNTEKIQILDLLKISKDLIYSESRYEKFNEFYAQIDITNDKGFNYLIKSLSFISNTLLLSYSLKAFGEYREGYIRYKKELNDLENQIKKKKGTSLIESISLYKQKLEVKYEKYIRFSGFWLWKEYSGKDDKEDDDVKEIFCKETIYIFLNKLLFLRICEDKNLLAKSISNGGIEQIRELFFERLPKDIINKETIILAFESAKGLYSHFYEFGILDWYWTGDGELNQILNRILWILNHYDFSNVDKDILGNLYEKYLPRKERKKLGEFYTPTSIIDYILDSVGYSWKNEIEDKYLLDPTCGSGGFLVRATRNLIGRYVLKFNKATEKELTQPNKWRDIFKKLTSDEAEIIIEAVQRNIIGIDINPFACHIAEMNMLFQIIDLYQLVRQNNSNYALERFKIYRSDSLETKKFGDILDFTYGTFLEEQEIIDKIKAKKFDFIVGNPPYGGILKRSKGTFIKNKLKKEYTTAFGKYDIYVLFIERSVSWLKTNGKFGFIIQNRFLRADYGKKLREYLLKNVKIDKIVDFGNTKIFKDATNYPCILIFEKESVKQNDFNFIEVKLSANELDQNQILELIDNKSSNAKGYINRFHINQSNLRSEAWIPQKNFIIPLINRIKNIEYLEDLNEEIMQGVTIGGEGGTKVYCIGENIINQYRIESDIIKKLLRGKNIKRWTINWANLYLIYPYKDIGNGKKEEEEDLSEEAKRLLNIKDYPNCHEYLKEHYDFLSNRTLEKKKITDYKGYGWYSLWRRRFFNVFKSRKILCPRVSKINNFALDDDDQFFFLDAAVGIIPKKNIDIKYLLGVLNSNLLFFIMKNTSTILSGGYYNYSKTYIEKLPIKIPITKTEKKIANQIIEKVDNIRNFYSAVNIDIDSILKDKECHKLINNTGVSFSIMDDAEFNEIKLKENKIYLNNDDFIEILDDHVRKFVEIYLTLNEEKLLKSTDLKSQIINIVIPKTKDTLNDILNKGALNLLDIEGEGSKKEKEINQLVYWIYGLSTDEIEFIESELFI